MKRKTPMIVRQVPVDFGDEPLCSVPIQQEGGLGHRKCLNVSTLGRFQSARFNTSTIQRFNALLFNPKSPIRNRKSFRGFTLVEILVVLVLLSLIVFALMAVFSGTQKAFRASLTQTDSLEGGRAVMDLITSDLISLTPANMDTNITPAPVNFYVAPKVFPAGLGPPTPLYQNLVGSISAQRTNVLDDIFLLGKANINGVPNWVATGYSVGTNLSDGALYPLYRFYMTTNTASGYSGLAGLYSAFNQFNYTNSANWSHLMDGVINLTARAYDTNGVWMTNGYADPNVTHVKFTRFHPAGFITAETYCAFYSNALPASVQIELGTLEDRVLAHAEGLGLGGVGQSNYLGNSASQVHLFRQRVWIRNVDTTAYQ